MDYQYNPQLKKPEQMPDIDPLQPAMKVMIKIMAKTKTAETLSYIPPEGIRIQRFSTASRDGSPLEIWSAEPETFDPKGDALVYIHGGAFWMPLSQSSLALACEYAKKLNIRVYLPEYRLVPAAMGQQIFEDCLSLWQSLCETGEHEQIAVLGESAGGALAAGLCMYCRDHQMRMPCGQLLIYPCLDDCFEKYPSAAEYADAVWCAGANAKMWRAYLRNAPQELIPYLVPMRNPDFANLPAAYIEPQEMDVLRDEALAFAEKLQNENTETEINMIEKSYHCFDSDLAAKPVTEAIDRRIHALMHMMNKGNQ